MNLRYSQFARHANLVAVIFLIVIFLLTLRGAVGNFHPNGKAGEKADTHTVTFESSLERGRYAQAISLAENLDFNVDEYPDFVRPDLAWYDGHYYPSFPSGVAFIATPLYIIGKFFSLAQVFTYATSAIFSILTAIVMLKIGRKLNLSKRAAVFSAIVFAVGSGAFAYSVTLSAHPVSAFLIAVCFWMSVSIIRGEKNYWYFFVLWFAYGLNFFVDYPNLFILSPLILITLLRTTFFKERQEKKIHFKFPLKMIFGAVALVPILYIFIIYNNYHYKQPITFSNKYNIRVLDIQGIKYDTLSNDLFEQKSYSSRFDAAGLIDGINILLISRDRGLFVYAPIFLLAVLGLSISYFKDEKWWEIVFLTFIANLVLYGAYDDPWGGWAFGPRYLIPTLPLLALAVGRAFDLVVKYGILPKIVISVLVIYGIGISLLGALTTNAIPPSVEVVTDEMTDYYLANWEFLVNGTTSSFIYGTFLSNLFTPLTYYIILFFCITVVALCIIWLRPKVETKMLSTSAIIKVYIPILIILVVSIFFANRYFAVTGDVQKKVINKGTAAGGAIPTFWKYQCIDTMKISRDQARVWAKKPTVEKDIEAQLSLIKGMGANCVALATPYDEEFLPHLKMWVEKAREKDLAVWFRGNWSSWEGWFGYPKGMTSEEHLAKTQLFILDNPDLFENGDIFTPAPEAENGEHFKGRDENTYALYRQFLVDQHNTAQNAFGAIGKTLEIDWFSMSGGVAKGMLDQNTIDAIGGKVTIDHYTKDAEGMEEFILYFKDKYKAKVVIGEFGAPIPDLNGIMNEAEQAKFIDALLQRMYKHRDTVEGISYWVLTGGSTGLASSTTNKPKLAVKIIRKYFAPGIVTGTVVNTLGHPLRNAKIQTGEAEDRSVLTDEAGRYEFILPVKDAELSIEGKGYNEAKKKVSITSGHSTIQDIVLEPENLDWEYRLELIIKDIQKRFF